MAEPEADPERDQRTVFAYQVTHSCRGNYILKILYLLYSVYDVTSVCFGSLCLVPLCM